MLKEGNSTWFCGPAHLPRSHWERAKLNEGQAAPSGPLGLGKSYDISQGTTILSKVEVAQRTSGR